jgi:type IV secretory pathway VirB2 component (pilin)
MVINIPSFEQEASFEAVAMVAPSEIATQQEMRSLTSTEATVVAVLGVAAIVVSMLKGYKQK